MKAVDYDNKSGSIRFAGVSHRIDAAKAAMNEVCVRLLLALDPFQVLMSLCMGDVVV